MSEFNTLHELYRHIKPALVARCEELSKENINVTEEDIFLCLSELKWRRATNLTIATMIRDIFNVTKEELKEGEKTDEEE